MIAISAALLVAAVILIFGYQSPVKKPAASSNASPKIVWTKKYLANEKLNFSYPSDWSETDVPASPSTDGVVLASPSNLLINIDTGATSSQNGFANILASVPIATLGANYYLDFYNNHAATGGLAQGACVATTPGISALYPSVRNIQTASDGSANPVNKVCMSYPPDESGNVFENTVAAFQNDPSFSQALNIIRSLSY